MAWMVFSNVVAKSLVGWRSAAFSWARDVDGSASVSEPPSGCDASHGTSISTRRLPIPTHFKPRTCACVCASFGVFDRQTAGAALCLVGPHARPGAATPSGRGEQKKREETKRRSERAGVGGLRGGGGRGGSKGAAWSGENEGGERGKQVRTRDPQFDQTTSGETQGAREMGRTRRERGGKKTKPKPKKAGDRTSRRGEGREAAGRGEKDAWKGLEMRLMREREKGSMGRWVGVVSVFVR